MDIKVKLKNVYKKAQSKVSAPILLYVILCLIAVLCFIFYKICTYDKIFINIFYGLVSSFVVALVTDVANTQTRNKIYKKNFEIIIGAVKVECAKILWRAASCAERRYGSDEEKRTFSEWVSLVFDENYNEDELSYSEYKDICFEFIVGILLIKEKAAQLINISKCFLENKNFNGEFIYELKGLKSICFSIKNDFDNSKFETCENKLSKRFTKYVVNAFPELEESFEKRYNINDLEAII